MLEVGERKMKKKNRKLGGSKRAGGQKGELIQV